MVKFTATIEYLDGQHAAIVALFDAAGEWSGAGRVEVRSGTREALYEQGYIVASRSAHDKGGRLERYSVVEAPAPAAPHREACSGRVTPAFLHRPANALNVEPMQPSPRCLDKRPSHWPAGSSSLRWIASGGSPLVFGPCTAICPRVR